MRCGAHVALLTMLLGGGVCPRSAAQGFNMRHNMFGWVQNSNGFSVEQNQAGEFIAFSNNPYVDTTSNLYWPSIAGSVRVSSTGQFLGQDTVFDPQKATYVGWSNCATRLPDGRMVVSGGTQNADTNWAALYWFDQNGLLLDHEEYLVNSRSWIAYQHKNTPDGGFIVGGVASVNGQQDILWFKTDSLGNLEWWHTYGHPTRPDWIINVDLAPGGGYYMSGVYRVTAQNKAHWVLRVDSAGSVVWERFPGTPVSHNYDVLDAYLTTLADGGLVVASGEWSGFIQNTWPQLVKLDTAGTVVWDKRYGVDKFASGFYVVQEVVPHGDLIACGLRSFDDGNGGAYWLGTLLRTTNEGDSLWMYDYMYYDSLMTDGGSKFRDVQPTPDGGFIGVGDAGGSISGNNPPGLSGDVWVVKVDSMGCLVPGCDDFSTAITVQATNLKDALSVYPNPAHGGTMAKVTLPAGSPFANDLRLRLVSAQGQEVLVQKAALGENQVPLRGLAAGVFYLHLTSGSTWLGGTKLIIE